VGGVRYSSHRGSGAVEKAIEENPYLILMDIMMLRMNGREATLKIRSITRDSRYFHPGSYASSQAFGTKELP